MKRTRNEAIHHLAENATPAEAQGLLESLRWKADGLITNHFGERVWLKEVAATATVIRHITDCCFEDDPCERHRAMQKAVLEKNR